MTFSAGTLPRLALAALMAPAVACLPFLAMDHALQLTSQARYWGGPAVTWFLYAWGALAVITAALGLLLRKIRKSRLRHHLLAGSAIGASFAIATLVEFIEILMTRSEPDNVIEVPYPCVELVRHETLDLPGGVAAMLFGSLVGAIFKWAACGPTREPTTASWKVAGVLYIVAWILFLIEPFHYIYGSIPSWTDWVSKSCDFIFL
jgi:hypothetical protein